MAWDCTPYPHYYDLLMPFVLIAAAVGIPTLLVLSYRWLYGPTVVEQVYPFNDRAPCPHCDRNVLHAPGKCEYCDMYPEEQAKRILAGVNFTGENDPNKKPCPAEERRSLDSINNWPGNRTSLAGDGEDD